MASYQRDARKVSLDLRHACIIAKRRYPIDRPVYLLYNVF